MATSATTNSNSSNTMDPVLSWGSSVNVNEDLRRSIRAECNQLDDQIKKITVQTTNESRKAQSLSKDLNFSIQEMQNLARGGTEEVEGCNMNANVRARMAEQLETELGRLLKKTPPVPVRQVEASRNNVKAPQDVQEGGDTYQQKVDDDNNSSKIKSKVDGDKKISQIYNSALLSYANICKKKVKKLEEMIKRNTAVNTKMKRQIANVRREAKSHLDRIVHGNLSAERRNLENEVIRKKRELDGEKSKMKSVLDQVQRARKRCGEQAQQITEQVSGF